MPQNTRSPRERKKECFLPRKRSGSSGTNRQNDGDGALYTYSKKKHLKKLKNAVDRTKTGAILDVYNRYEMLI